MEIKVMTPALPVKLTDTFWQSVQRTVMCLLRGKSNNIGIFTVETDTTETKVLDSRVTQDSHISIIGLDNNSKAGVLSIKERNGEKGYFIVEHPSSDISRNFSYAVIG